MPIDLPASPEGWIAVALAVLALALGGVLKGATGAGAPIVAVPVIALYFDVQTAVVTLILPNLLSNVVQGWRYRMHMPEGGFPWVFAAAGLVGAGLGTVLLTQAPPQRLLQLVAGVVVLYVAFRLMRPDWRLAMPVARRLAVPMGVAAGVLQGATGVSAPISITFLSALGLGRMRFVAAISLFFVAMSVAQMPVLAGYGALTLQRLVLSLGALLVIVSAMPLGEALARRLSPAFFDRLILVLLTAVALRIVWTSLG